LISWGYAAMFARPLAKAKEAASSLKNRAHQLLVRPLSPIGVDQTRSKDPRPTYSPAHAPEADRRSVLDVVPAPRDVIAPSAPHFEFRRIPIFPPDSKADFRATEVPTASVRDDDAVEQPGLSGGSPAVGPTGGGAATPTASDSCDEPRSMGKTISGGFLGGLKMDDYYPDVAGRGGFWQHPGTGGTFDTGSRVGGVAQLFGVIPSPCEPSQFSLAQSVTRTRDRIDGVTNPTEGQTLDDFGKSGRDIAHAPFRQEFLGGGTAPLGYLISAADPPSIPYGPATNAEWDRDFVTSLIGPRGRQSVSWSLSIRIENGVVKRNSLS
jgi:hypothetical protein